MNDIQFKSHNWLALKINNLSLAKYLPFVEGRVVDLGCGTCPYKEDILKVADEYIGVDWENGLHDQQNVDIFADLTRPLPLTDNYADTIVSFQVMEHLAEPDAFLSECYRILRSGGGIFITVPFMWHVHEAPHDYFRYTQYGLRHLLGKSGFVDIVVNENTGFWQTWVLKFNYHTHRLARGPLKYVAIPVWWFGQVVAPILDRYDYHPEETAGFTVRARKPA